VSIALVLGGGGITGIAWEIGVLSGLRRAGIDLTKADLIVGTSAGSVVATIVATGIDLDVAVAMQREPVVGEPLNVDIGLAMQAFAILGDRQIDPREARARVGALALSAPVGDEQAQIDRFAERLPRHDWPREPRLVITGVDARTGEAVAWDHDSGVPLVHAVAASCAVPCVYPPITINGQRYVDGGLRSGTNAYLAAGVSEVVVLAPMAGMTPLGAPASELAALRERATVTLVQPDTAARTAIGPNVLDAYRRAAALDAGLVQGEALARNGGLGTG
jgi:NTE family protein